MSNILLWYATRGAGAMTLILLTGSVALGVMAAAKPASAAWPRFASAALHRNLALMSLAFLGLHIVTAAIDPFTHLGWLVAVVPFSSYYRTFYLGLGTLAFDLLLAVAITSALRSRLGQGVWRAVHWTVYAAWPIGLLHGLGTGSDAGSLWFLGITWACVLTVICAVWYRLSHGAGDTMSRAREEFRVNAQP